MVTAEDVVDLALAAVDVDVVVTVEEEAAAVVVVAAVVLPAQRADRKSSSYVFDLRL